MAFERGQKNIVFVSHNLDTIKAICDRVLLLNKGRIESQGESREVISAYLDMLKARAKARPSVLPQERKISPRLRRCEGGQERPER